MGKGGGRLGIGGSEDVIVNVAAKSDPNFEGIASRVRGLHNLVPQDSQSFSWKMCGSRPAYRGSHRRHSPGAEDPADDAAPMISIDGPCATSRSNRGSGKSGNPGSLILDHRARRPSRPEGE